MAKDIFNREVSLGEPVSSEAMTLMIPGLINEDFLGQSVNLNYQQAITRLYEVGSAKTYFVAGRTQGQLQVRRLVGAKGPASQFIEKYGDVCKVAGNNITMSFSAGCSTGQKVGAIDAEGVVLASVGYAVQAQDTMVMEDLSAQVALVKKVA